MTNIEPYKKLIGEHNWEKQFDEADIYDGYGGGLDERKVKKFISNLLASQKKELVSKLEKIKKKLHNHPDCEVDTFIREPYNRALNDVISLLSEEQKYE